MMYNYYSLLNGCLTGYIVFIKKEKRSLTASPFWRIPVCIGGGSRCGSKPYKPHKCAV